jgi:outer membrane protein
MQKRNFSCAGRRWVRCAALVAVACCAQQACAQATPQPAPGLLLIDAIRLSLRQNVNTLLQEQQVVTNEGSVLQQKGPFDPLANVTLTRARTATTLPGYQEDPIVAAGITNVFQEKTDVTSNTYSLSKMFLNGWTVTGGYGITSTIDNLNNLLYDIQNGGRETTGKLSFSVTAPLLKNAGVATVGAQLFAAQAQLEASKYSLVFTNAQTVLGATADYWSYLSARKNLDIAISAEENAKTLLDQVQKLIAADENPRSDIDLAVASRAERSANRIAAEQAVIDSRRILARQMGMPVEQMFRLPLPADDYPDFDVDKIDFARDTERLVLLALDKRADLEANRQLKLSASYLVAAARNNLKPELDLSAGGSYAGLAEGAHVDAYERAYYTNRYGPSFNVSLSFTWPIGNSQARGALISALAQESTAVITIRDLEATIASNVTTQVTGLRHSVQQLAESVESVRRYTTAVQNELTKRQAGTATLLDVVNMEDRLVSAQVAEIAARQAYAVAIAQLRYETGTLVRKDGNTFDVRIRDVLYPDFSASQ